MSETYELAVVGATTVVGETIVSVLAERGFPVGSLYVLDEGDAVGMTVEFGDQSLAVRELAEFDFSQADVTLFAGDPAQSRNYAHRAAEAGSAVIDNSGVFAREPDVPLVMTELNADAIERFEERGIIASPGAVAAALGLVLKPIHAAAGIRRIEVATYQAVSDCGKAAIEELARQTAQLLNGRPAEPRLFPKQIAFNVLPRIGALEANGYTAEEMAIAAETGRLVGEPLPAVNATAVRVPVFYGHAAAVHLECAKSLSPEAVRALLGEAPGVDVLDRPEAGGWPSPVTEGAGSDRVRVGRIRQDCTRAEGLDLWLVADNSRVGAALNSVQIAEILVKEYL